MNGTNGTDGTDVLTLGEEFDFAVEVAAGGEDAVADGGFGGEDGEKEAAAAEDSPDGIAVVAVAEDGGAGETGKEDEPIGGDDVAGAEHDGRRAAEGVVAGTGEAEWAGRMELAGEAAEGGDGEVEGLPVGGIVGELEAVPTGGVPAVDEFRGGSVEAGGVGEAGDVKADVAVGGGDGGIWKNGWAVPAKARIGVCEEGDVFGPQRVAERGEGA